MDENQTADFSELNNLAHEILSAVKDDLGTARTELEDTKRKLDDLKDLPAELAKSQEAKRRLEGERDYLRGEVSKLTAGNQSLTAELKKSQEAQGYLQGELSRLNDSYQTLMAGLLKAQAEASNAKAEASTLRSKIAQIQKTLAG